MGQLLLIKIPGCHQKPGLTTGGDFSFLGKERAGGITGSRCWGLSGSLEIHKETEGARTPQETSEDIAVAQFWVRNAGFQGRVLFGGKEPKGKSSTAGEGFCITCFISGAATGKGWSRMAGRQR